jgi:hypothetical protein
MSLLDCSYGPLNTYGHHLFFFIFCILLLIFLLCYCLFPLSLCSTFPLFLLSSYIHFDLEVHVMQTIPDDHLNRNRDQIRMDYQHSQSAYICNVKRRISIMMFPPPVISYLRSSSDLFFLHQFISKKILLLFSYVHK